MRLRNFKVRTKMIALGIMIVGVLFIVFQGFLKDMKSISESSLEQFDKMVREDYDENIKNQVDNAISMLDAVYADYEAGEYTLEEAKKLGADLLRGLRYGEEGYFWADTYEGDNVVLLGSDTEGTNRLGTKDANGYEMVKDIIKNGRQPEGGFTDYSFPKEGGTESFPKRSYSRAFEPFEWVIGTGNYTDSLDGIIADRSEEQNSSMNSRLSGMLVQSILLLAVLALFTVMIAMEMVKALKTALHYNKLLGEGDFTATLPDRFLIRKDDFGTLFRVMDQMKANVGGVLKGIHTDTEEMAGITEEIKGEVAAVNAEIENVSATTQELAAGMEETAASSQEITAMSQKVEEAARGIAARSEEGAQRVNEILERAEKAQKDTREDHEAARAINRRIKASLSEALQNVKVVEEIDVLSETIMGITTQTNLLALNASIEAARAGEAGKGFAVVADQIRLLAEQSKKAVTNIQTTTEQVRKMVKELSEDSKELLDFVSSDVSKSYNGFEVTAKAYREDSEYVDGIIKDFSNASAELLTSISGILQAVEEVGSASNEGAKGTSDTAQRIVEVVDKTSQMTAAVTRANEIVNQLNEEVRQFKIN